jgi:hypothetical protein
MPLPFVTFMFRIAFVVYTITLLTATHWPGLAVKGPFSRTDLMVHLGAFGLWTLLLGMTGWVRSKTCVRRRALIVGLIGMGFGAFDELTQPLFRRVFDWLDLGADMSGAVLASLVLFLFWYWKNGNRCMIDPESAPESTS